MKFRLCGSENNLSELIRNVYASFGYEEAEIESTQPPEKSYIKRLFYAGGGRCGAVISGDINDMVCSEAAAAAAEAMLSAEIPDFSFSVTCTDRTAELLSLYGLDDYMTIAEGDFSFSAECGGRTILRSETGDGFIKSEFDLTAAVEASDGAFDMVPMITVVFAESGAEGIAYDVSYTMRVSGCLAEMYVQGGDIAECEAYAKSAGASDLIRVFPDGKVMIKEMASSVVTETDSKTFIGYYDEPEHDHGHDCGCHHHE